MEGARRNVYIYLSAKMGETRKKWDMVEGPKNSGVPTIPKPLRRGRKQL